MLIFKNIIYIYTSLVEEKSVFASADAKTSALTGILSHFISLVQVRNSVTSEG